MPSQLSILKKENRRLRDELAEAKKQLAWLQDDYKKLNQMWSDTQEAAACWALTLEHFGPAKHEWLRKIIGAKK